MPDEPRPRLLPCLGGRVPPDVERGGDDVDETALWARQEPRVGHGHHPVVLAAIPQLLGEHQAVGVGTELVVPVHGPGHNPRVRVAGQPDAPGDPGRQPVLVRRDRGAAQEGAGGVRRELDGDAGAPSPGEDHDDRPASCARAHRRRPAASAITPPPAPVQRRAARSARDRAGARRRRQRAARAPRRRRAGRCGGPEAGRSPSDRSPGS